MNQSSSSRTRVTSANIVLLVDNVSDLLKGAEVETQDLPLQQVPQILMFIKKILQGLRVAQVAVTERWP